MAGLACCRNNRRSPHPLPALGKGKIAGRQASGAVRASQRPCGLFLRGRGRFDKGLNGDDEIVSTVLSNKGRQTSIVVAGVEVLYNPGTSLLHPRRARLPIGMDELTREAA